MSVYRAERITKPRHFRIAPLSRGRGPRPTYVIGFDSESEKSRAFALQFSLPGKVEHETLLVHVPRKEHAALHAFMDVLHRVCVSRKYEYLVYGYNMAYEFTQLFHDFGDDAKQAADWQFDYVMPDGTSYEWTVYNSKRHYAVILNKSAHTRIRLLDAYAFFSTSLDKAARMLGYGGKLDAPLFARSQFRTRKFQAYAKRDAYLTRLLGERIVSMHREYDVRTCISAPHFASSVFRRKFLTDEVALPNERLEQHGLYSYHGGKNGYYRDGPADLDNVRAYDIRSAYPEAMRALPDITRGTWQPTIGYTPGVDAIWRATIEYEPCLYRGMQNAAGTWNGVPGRYSVHLTSYELDAMVSRGEARVVRAVGHVYSGPSGGPLAEYVDTFYALKSTTPHETERVTAKLFLNSLYGKFFQKVAVGYVGTYVWETGDYVASDPDADADYIAGGLYHPPIASLITGYVRAKIHGLEHRYDAIMTSTDGVFAWREPMAGDIGTALGQLDVSIGRLRIWRERLYLFDTGVHGVESCPDAAACKEHKSALHGFRGDSVELAAVPLTRGRYDYTAQQVVTLGMSTRKFSGRYWQPGEFVTLPFALDV